MSLTTSLRQISWTWHFVLLCFALEAFDNQTINESAVA